MMRRMAALIAAMALTGCATRQGPDHVITKTVLVPVATPCVANDRPAPPQDLTPAQLLAAPDFAARYQMLAAWWTLARPFLAGDEAQLAACAKVPAPK